MPLFWFWSKLRDYQHGHYYQPPVILIRTLWKFLEIFSDSMTRDSEGLEGVRIFFWEPGVVECENSQFFSIKLGEYQHVGYYQVPVNLMETLWKFLEIFSGSLTRVSEDLEWVRIFFLEPGWWNVKNPVFLALNWGNTNTAITTRYQ